MHLRSLRALALLDERVEQRQTCLLLVTADQKHVAGAATTAAHMRITWHSQRAHRRQQRLLPVSLYVKYKLIKVQ